MHSPLLVLGMAALIIVPLLVAGGPVQAQDTDDDGLRQATVVFGDFLATWHSGRGAAVAYRGIPLLEANPSEFVVHRRWEQVLYRNSTGAPTGALSRDADEAVLTVSDRTEAFAFTKRIVMGREGRLRLEYEYEILEPEDAEIQLLFGLGTSWSHGAEYRIVAGEQERTGTLQPPETGRIDPWHNATRQAFTSEFGTLDITAQRGLNLYITPDRGALWWTQALRSGEAYSQLIEVTVQPGPAADTGVRISDVSWPHVVRTGHADCTVGLARAPDGPRRVRVQVEAAEGGQITGEAVEADLTEDPQDIACEMRLQGRGNQRFAIVISDAADARELLRLAPLSVEASPYFSAQPALSLYTHEQTGHVLVRVAEDLDLAALSLAVATAGRPETRLPVEARRTHVPIPLADLEDGITEVTCRLLHGEETLSEATTPLHKAPPKDNEVKINNATGGLIVDGLPFIPFGFYTYYPIKEGIIEEEVVRGFNLFSPYHRGPNDEEKLAEIRAYMDRCADVGMKVNYHVMWTNRAEMTEEHWELLAREVEAFRDHPALLTWYIADEPAADRVPHLERVYARVKELDPHHPVTIVFYRGAQHARRFVNATDIIMADPYPIPHGSVTAVSRMAVTMMEAFDPPRMLWMVPQCFGGGEGWRREPTAREQRVMTYLSLIHGARAIQYFIRSPRVSFPKSPIMWAECGALALETADLTPALLSEEPRPAVSCDQEAVHAAAFRHRGSVTVLAANTENRPVPMRIELPGMDFTGEARVLFENRTTTLTEGAIEEFIDAYGTRAYSVQVEAPPADDLAIHPDNLTVNPSWEDNPSVGTPAGNYSSIGPGATFFVDSRVARHGVRSARIHRPVDGGPASFSPFPVRLHKDTTYRVSIWAKARGEGVRLRVSLGRLGAEEFAPGPDWQEYAFLVTSEADVPRAAGNIALETPGTVWLDLFQIWPVEGEGR